MNRYLQRFLTRGVGDAAVARVLPVVRSTSPIGEIDQRVGMLGFEGFPFGPAASVEGAPEDAPAPSGHLLSEVPSASINGENAGAAAPQRRSVARRRAGDLAGPRSADTPLMPGAGAAHEAPGTVRVPDRAALPREPLDEARFGLRDHVTAVRHAERLNAATSHGTGDAGVLAPRSADDPTIATRPGSTRAETPRPRSGLSPEAGAPLLEPSRRPIASAHHEEVMSAIAESGMPDPGPQVVIGRINVEVVSPSAEPKTSTASAGGPLTAESVSVIGPLTGTMRSNLRFSLRYR